MHVIVKPKAHWLLVRVFPPRISVRDVIEPNFFFFSCELKRLNSLANPFFFRQAKNLVENLKNLDDILFVLTKFGKKKFIIDATSKMINF